MRETTPALEKRIDLIRYVLTKACDGYERTGRAFWDADIIPLALPAPIAPPKPKPKPKPQARKVSKPKPRKPQGRKTAKRATPTRKRRVA